MWKFNNTQFHKGQIRTRAVESSSQAVVTIAAFTLMNSAYIYYV